MTRFDPRPFDVVVTVPRLGCVDTIAVQSVRREYAELRVPVEECCPSCQRRVGLTHDLHTLNRRRAALISLIARHPDTGAPPRPPRQPKPRRPVWTPDIDPAPAYPQPKPLEEGDDVPF